MEWKSTKEAVPQEGKLIIFFQSERKRYNVGRYEKSGTSMAHIWRGESGNALRIYPNDHWMYLEPVTIVATYS